MVLRVGVEALHDVEALVAGECTGAVAPRREAGALAAALRVNPWLQEDERTTLAHGAEALARAQTSINDNRINKNTTTRGLPRTHATNLRSLAMTLTAVRARLNAIYLEVPHAPAN